MTTPKAKMGGRCQGCGGKATHRWRQRLTTGPAWGAARKLGKGRPVCGECVELWLKHGRHYDRLEAIA